MALITCPEYGRQISDRAERCPACGCPRAEMQSMKKEQPVAGSSQQTFESTEYRVVKSKSLQIKNILDKVGGRQREIFLSGSNWSYFYYNTTLAAAYRADKEYFPLVPQALVMTNERDVYATVVLPKNYANTMSDTELLYRYGIPVLNNSAGPSSAMIKLKLGETFSEDDFYGEIVRAKQAIAKLFNRPIGPEHLYTEW